jgi:hypothetical protein
VKPESPTANGRARPMATRPEMIPPGQAAELLARWAAPATDPGKAHAAIEKIRDLCDSATAAGSQVTPGQILDLLDGTEEPVISGTEPGTRLPVAWALDDAIALTREPGTECAWTPHPYYTSHCLLVVARRSGRTIYFNVPAPA